MEELRDFLSGEGQFTILLSKGGAVRGNGITVLADTLVPQQFPISQYAS